MSNELKKLKVQYNLLGQEIEDLEKKEDIKRFPHEWRELGEIIGFYICEASMVTQQNTPKCTYDARWSNTFATKEQAESARAMAMLSQLMERCNDNWKPNWNWAHQTKYVIVAHENSLVLDTCCTTHHFLSFPTPGIRNRFRDSHHNLIKTYFMINEE